MDPKLNFDMNIVKEYKGKQYCAYLYLIKSYNLKSYHLFINRIAEEKNKKELSLNEILEGIEKATLKLIGKFEISFPIEEIEKIIKEKIGEFKVVGGKYE